MSIRRKDDSGNLWVIDVTQGRGARHKETFRGSKEAADILHAQIKRRLGVLTGQKTVAEIAGEFLEDLKKPGRSLAQSPRTFHNTELRIAALVRRFGNFCIDAIPEQELLRFRDARLEEIAKKYTRHPPKAKGVRAVNLDIITLNSLNRFAREKKYCTERIPAIKPLKYRMPAPKPIDRKEVWAIIDKMRGVKKLLALCMYAAGGRKFEIFKILWGDIDLERRVIYTLGKGGLPEYMDIPPELLKEFKVYLASFKQTPPRDALVFPPVRGKARWSITKALQAAAKKAGVQRHVTEHVLRHSFATHLLEDGADPRLVQEKLRHQKLDMILRYTHVARKRQQEASDKTFQRPKSDV
jgi:integrase/recombinase XerD